MFSFPCKTRLTHTHIHISEPRGRIVKVASEWCGAESTHSKLRLRRGAKHGADFDANLRQKHGLKVENSNREV